MVDPILPGNGVKPPVTQSLKSSSSFSVQNLTSSITSMGGTVIVAPFYLLKHFILTAARGAVAVVRFIFYPFIDHSRPSISAKRAANLMTQIEKEGPSSKFSAFFEMIKVSCVNTADAKRAYAATKAFREADKETFETIAGYVIEMNESLNLEVTQEKTLGELVAEGIGNKTITFQQLMKGLYLYQVQGQIEEDRVKDLSKHINLCLKHKNFIPELQERLVAYAKVNQEGFDQIINCIAFELRDKSVKPKDRIEFGQFTLKNFQEARKLFFIDKPENWIQSGNFDLEVVQKAYDRFLVDRLISQLVGIPSFEKAIAVLDHLKQIEPRKEFVAKCLIERLDKTEPEFLKAIAEAMIERDQHESIPYGLDILAKKNPGDPVAALKAWAKEDSFCFALFRDPLDKLQSLYICKIFNDECSSNAKKLHALDCALNRPDTPKVALFKIAKDLMEFREANKKLTDKLLVEILKKQDVKEDGTRWVEASPKSTLHERWKIVYQAIQKAEELHPSKDKDDLQGFLGMIRSANYHVLRSEYEAEIGCTNHPKKELRILALLLSDSRRRAPQMSDQELSKEKEWVLEQIRAFDCAHQHCFADLTTHIASNLKETEMMKGVEAELKTNPKNAENKHKSDLEAYEKGWLKHIKNPPVMSNEEAENRNALVRAEEFLRYLSISSDPKNDWTMLAKEIRSFLEMKA